MRFLGGGDLWKQLLNIPEMKDAANQMMAVAGQIERGEISQAEASDKQLEILLRGLGQYGEKYGPQSLRRMLGKVGLSEDLENLTRVPFDELISKARKYAAAVRELDPEQVEKFWKAWHNLSRELDNFTNAVLAPFLPKFTEFIDKFARPRAQEIHRGSMAEDSCRPGRLTSGR